ncbi:UNVERIFIED_ORG: SET domain-containing protein [Burkholderia sp. 1263]
MHGKGVFALLPLAAGERVLEYRGEITTWRNALRRHRHEGVTGHTFLFDLSDGRVIDGSRGGNSARWLNHACTPNCETIEDGERIFIHTLRPIDAGEELFIDYLLAIDGPEDEEARAQYACACPALRIVGGCYVSGLVQAGHDSRAGLENGPRPDATG